MRIIGQVLLWAGFLAGALATVFNLSSKGVEFIKSLTPESDEVAGFELQDLAAVQVPVDGWDLIPWVWYSIAATVCVAGVVLLHLGKKASGQKSEQSAASLSEIKSALGRLIENTKALESDIRTLAPSKIVARIDDVLADDLRIFADGRDSMTTEYGLAVFADVMSQFAAGERAINRAWSASADGYLDEAADCIERACQMLVAADRELNEAGKK